MGEKTARRSARLAIGYLTLFFVNGCYFAWNILSNAFAEAFPYWTEDMLALCGALYWIVSATSGLLVHRLLRRCSVPALLRVFGVLTGLGWGIVSLLCVRPAIGLYTGYSLAAFANGAVYILIGQVLNAWYPGRSGAVSGGMLLASGVGAFCVGMLETRFIRAFGILKFCPLLALGLCAAVMFCAPWMQMPTLSRRQEDGNTAQSGLCLAAKQPAFWFFFAWLAPAASGGLLVINNAASIFQTFRVPQELGMVTNIFCGFGGMLMGILVDRRGLRCAMLSSSFFSLAVSAAMIIGQLLDVPGLVLTGVLLGSVGYGTTTSAKMAGIIRLYSAENLTAFFGVINLNVIPAALLGPYASGLLLTLGCGFFPCFLLSALLAAAAVLSVLDGSRSFRNA